MLPTLRVPRIAQRIRIDGDLLKAPWREIAPTALVDATGRPGARALQPTALRVAHDGERLLLGFACVDSDIWGTHSGRNAPIYEEEVVEAFLAPSGDPRRYFELETNPLGAWFEARIENADGDRRTMRVDRDWVCAGWERALSVDGDLARRDGSQRGWSAEWAIPFAALGAAPPAPGSRWRANFFRIDRANGGEFSAWSPTLADPPDFHVPERFGVLAFE